MGKNSSAKILVTGVAVFVLVATSFGGTLAPAALAATGGQSAQFYGDAAHSHFSVDSLVAVGLVSLFSNHGMHSAHFSTLSGHDVSSPTVQPPASQPVPQPVVSPAPAAPKLGTGNSASVNAEEQQAFRLLNADRAANGLPPLRISAALTGLAETYAQDMINRNFFSHTNPQGQSPFDRMRQAGIAYGYAGENLAINVSVPEAEQAFMNSPGHRANILNSHYTQVGVGVRHSSNGSVYVVQEFTDG
ncbi:MAG: CAP domain-containing protein [Negativicutes bacterium]|nr:CAP domain-containing protein [Negativicutes bacterium]